MLDVSDAYGSILIDPPLQRLFCTQCVNAKGKIDYFKLLTLPQGWQWSSALFSVAMTFLIELIESKHKPLFVAGGVVVNHYQDDVIISCEESLARQVTELVQAELAAVGLKCNAAKTQGPSKSVFSWSSDRSLRDYAK